MIDSFYHPVPTIEFIRITHHKKELGQTKGVSKDNLPQVQIIYRLSKDNRGFFAGLGEGWLIRL